jgi:hypothetical protein
MSSDFIFQQLARLILESPYVDPEDRLVLKQVVYRLKLYATNLEDINDKIKGQIEIEAAISYMSGKYLQKMNDAQAEMEEIEATKLSQMPDKTDIGYKVTEKERKTLLAIDPDTAIARKRFSEKQTLYKNLQSILKIVFKRDDKINNLCVNYRKELKLDQNSEG